MHSKWKASRERYLDFIQEAVLIFGEGNVRSLLMVGIEPLEDTLRGIEALAKSNDLVMFPKSSCTRYSRGLFFPYN